MSYLPALFATLAVYGLLAVLLLSLNIVSLWRWWVKLGAIVLTTAVFFAAYFAITGLIGWPSPQPVPDRFSLLATRIVEPDKVSGAPGHLYLWVEAVDQANLPVAQPRSHEVAYTAALANQLYAAQQKLNNGQLVLGEMLEPPRNDVGSGEQGALEGEDNGSDDSRPRDPGADQLPMTGGASERQESPGDGYLLDITESLQLSDMPPPELPDKGPL